MIIKFETQFVDSLPNREDMKENIVYVSEKSWQSTHLCACGCGEEVVTPHLKGGWRYYTNEADDITLSPSIYNPSCDTQYDINQGYAIV